MRLFLLTIFTLSFHWNAYAQNPPPPKAIEQIEELLGKKKQETTEPVTLNQFANKHFNNCSNTKHPIIIGQDLLRLCACTRDRFLENMSIPQIRAMQKNDDEGRYQKSRMLLFVYAPCIKFPLNRMISTTCMRNVQNKYLMKSQSATCQCIADRVSEASYKLIGKYMQGIIKLKMEDREPLNLLVKENHFNDLMFNHTKQCLREFEGIY